MEYEKGGFFFEKEEGTGLDLGDVCVDGWMIDKEGGE